VINVALVGSRDRQLDELLRSAGMQTVAIDSAKLSSFASHGARQPDVIVLDLRGGAGLPQAVAAITRQHPATGVVIVATALDPGMLLEAMRAGVNEVVSDPVTQADLESAIARVIGQRTMAQVGQVFGFVGAKGGVGTTTVAVNVATVLGTFAKPAGALLVDLHCALGDAAVFLGAEPRFSVVDALENTGRLDPTFFRSLVTHTRGLDLLASSDRAVAGQVDPTRIRTLIDVISSVYAYSVLDLPRSDSAVLDALDGLSAIVIVANQELATVRSATRLGATLRQRYGAKKVSVVVSRSDRQADICHEDVERAIGSAVAHTFPSNYREALQALNKGQPLALDNHSELSSSLKSFAMKLAGLRSERPTAPAPRQGLLARFTKRQPILIGKD
jgi:pilus assembly protein CpaE